MARLLIDEEACTGCEACVEECPYGALEMKGDVVTVNEKCTFCGACVDVCPVEALTLEKEEKEAQGVDISEYKDVWVFIEHKEGKDRQRELGTPWGGEKAGRCLRVQTFRNALGGRGRALRPGSHNVRGEYGLPNRKPRFTALQN